MGYNMFAYCLNNPVIYVDTTGTEAKSGALQTWATSMWWLTGVDGFAIIGDLIYWCGLAVIGVASVYAWLQIVDTISVEAKEEVEPEAPDVTYPGDDPEKEPEGTTWKGKGEKGSKEGNYYDPEKDISWHPDLNHPDPIGPHWDLKDQDGKWWRVSIDGDGNTVIKPK